MLEINKDWFVMATFLNVLSIVLIVVGFIFGEAEDIPVYKAFAFIDFISICVYLGTTYKYRKNIFNKE